MRCFLIESGILRDLNKDSDICDVLSLLKVRLEQKFNDFVLSLKASNVLRPLDKPMGLERVANIPFKRKVDSCSFPGLENSGENLIKFFLRAPKFFDVHLLLVRSFDWSIGSQLERPPMDLNVERGVLGFGSFDRLFQRSLANEAPGSDVV